MKNTLKIFYSLALLIAFLLPQIEQQVHAFEHLNDSHCSSTDNHFHEQEHSCDICDYTFPSHFTSISSDFSIKNTISDFDYQFTFYSKFSNKNINQLPARAPPLV